MLRYLLFRLGTMVSTLLVASVLIFAIIQLPPGDYLTNYIGELRAEGETQAEEKVAFLREQYGLDQPLPVQYLHWISGFVQGDFGYSFEYAAPVSDVIGDRVFLTLVLNFATVLFVYLVAFPLGLFVARRKHSAADRSLTLAGYLGLATPNFLLALVLLYLSNWLFGISIGGLMDPTYAEADWSAAKVGSVLAHLVVPVVVIGLSGTAAMIQRLRANLLDELRRPYVVAATARGLSDGFVLRKYALRSALNPFVSDIGDLLPQIVSGSVIISVIMSLPTTGPMLLSSLRSQDMYLAGSFLMFLAILTVVGMLVSDLALALIDPRVRLTGQRAP
ncbi:ABC transporter permease [Aureimonas jatrophae]|uniref:Peptide/nickel transport system permease protein n=1 Tax=Aureimonas jatrophae TaxID=1166073 RepID=A0A1H0EV83_9HYPH|nr:ABC transporter permease [Aureimonas jatrophae]MBB3950299.1 peptide/nickel transport system permease protein [Aureimonas jatrophae]SDN86253.1 peptide/nickel transport system permease protein [Aureimonas jatrophae]